VFGKFTHVTVNMAWCALCTNKATLHGVTIKTGRILFHNHSKKS